MAVPDLKSSFALATALAPPDVLAEPLGVASMDRHDRSVMISEAVGPALPLSAVAAAIAMGVFALLMAGVLPVLLGGLIDAGRLTAEQIGLAAMAEGVTMGLCTGAASALLKPARLRLIAILATLALAGLDLGGIWASGAGQIFLRGLAGVPEGILLWIAIGMIARSEMPERFSAILLAAMTAGQFVLALALTAFVLPLFGSNGGFLALALGTLPAIGIALWLVDEYAPLVAPVGESASPPLRGWAALAATVVFTASFPAVAVYLQPIAHQAGLSAGVARVALTVSLLTQIGGGAAATVLAGRVHYLPVLGAGSALYLISWAVMGGHPPAWGFVAANGFNGFAYLALTPFLVPMTIEADPSRRAAMMSGGAQVLAGALGPFAASQIVSDANVHGALWLASGFLLAGLAMICGLYLAERRDAAHRQLAVVKTA